MNKMTETTPFTRRIRELELQVAYLRGYSGIKQIDFENACERYGMGKAVEE